ncbi:MAG TPA: glycosyltransferase [Thermodesulfobacteriota bacterium]|jgi:glycosyltransferase involved in cell wall biosynthesis|nr:glycosyltransferase [Treponemataceae bacterium]HQO79259.1 glycosyltransferase [Thermodesulfobacteriota bacterium]
MRILWLSSLSLISHDEGGGSWQRAIAPHLLRSGRVTLGNVTVGPVSQTVREDYGGISQWIVPGVNNSNKNYLPSEAAIRDIVRVAEEFRPDIVHVWGTEFFWGLLTGRRILSYPSLLEIQGLKGPLSRVFTGGLSLKEILACIGIKEILRRHTILQGKKRFARWAYFENEIIAKHSNISTQSPWAEAWIRFINPSCNLFHTELVLRDAFYESEPWKPSEDFNIFTSAVAPAPFKGLHDAVRAVAILRDRIPSIKLRIAGGHQRKGIRQEGYIRWVNKMIRRYDLSKNVDWLGSLSEKEVAQELVGCAVALVPSYCETYCVAFAEAMQLGVPVVSSFTGGAAWLAKDEETALFYPAGDHVMCAHQLWRILTNPELARCLSGKGREIADGRNDPEKIVLNQIDIYRRVLHANKCT